ncbi:Tas retrotransposon peptidase A16 [Ostertagia ostertagi]
MTSTLSTRQGILTKACGRLSAALKDQENTNIPSPEDVTAYRSYQTKRLREIRKAKLTIEKEVNSVEKALEHYTIAADNLDPETPASSDIIGKVNTNGEAAQNLLDMANTKLTQLIKEEFDIDNDGDVQEQAITMHESPHVALPPIPIPKFDGKIWEWETFWGAFNHSVHSREMDDLYKMNYLLDALQGEAKESIKQYEVSRATYPAVISYLHDKYGDKQALLDQLLKKLQTARATSDRLGDQENLCERLISLVNQLKLKGEHIDNVFLQKQLLGKFSSEYNVMSCLLHELISEPKERSFNTRRGKKSSDYSQTDEHHNQRKPHLPASTAISRDIHPSNARIFDLEMKELNHKEKEPVPQLRGARSSSDALQQRSLQDVQRKRSSYLYLQKGDLHKASTNDSRNRACKRTSVTGKCETKTASKDYDDKDALRLLRRSDNRELAADTVLHVGNSKRRPDTLILAGEALVFNPRSQMLEKVHVMLDSGADRSFISEELADRLQLPEAETTVLTINTFGSTTPMKKKCGTTTVKLWDRDGNPHSYSVSRIDILTEPIYKSTLTAEDKKFLCENDITLSISPKTSKIRADILLGCADLFTLLEEDVGQQRTLPSGLKILPSKLGYLVIGKAGTSNKEELVAVSKARSRANSGSKTEPDLLFSNESDEGSARTVADHILIECAKQDTQMATSTTIATTPDVTETVSHDVLLNNTPSQDQGSMISSEGDSTKMWEQFYSLETSGVQEFIGPTARERQDRSIQQESQCRKYSESRGIRRAMNFRVSCSYPSKSKFTKMYDVRSTWMADSSHVTSEAVLSRALGPPLRMGHNTLTPTSSPEMEKNSCVVTVCKTLDQQPADLLCWKRYKSLSSCQTSIAYVLRFIRGISSRVDKNLRARIEQHIPELSQMTTEPYVTANEREMALRALIRNHQQVHVQDSRRNVLKQLKLQADSHGILRCRGPNDNCGDSKTKRNAGSRTAEGVPTQLTDTLNPRYNLRTRTNAHVTSIPSTVLLLTMALLTVHGMKSEITTSERHSTHGAVIRCIQGGVQLSSSSAQRYEICADNHCHVKDNPPEQENVVFPPEVTLRDYHVQWKLYDGSQLMILDATCPDPPHEEALAVLRVASDPKKTTTEQIP